MIGKTCNHKERRLNNLERELIAAIRGPQLELSFADIQKRGLLTVLREQARCKGSHASF